MTHRDEKYLRLMRELPCAGCGAEDGTVVAAHRNQGKGMGIKVSDALVVPLCYRCHTEFDQGKEMSRDGKRMYWDACYIKTVEYMLERGILKINKERL